MRKTGVVLILALVSVLSGCFEKELTPAEKTLVESLRRELKATQEDISDAKSRDALLAGGLVKSLISVRLEILETNKALLGQRINAIEAGSPVTLATEISLADSELAKSLEEKIAQEKADLELAKADAAIYGGLVGAMKATAAATREQTLAMLEQRYLVAKYGLNPALHKASGSNSPAPAEPSPVAQSPAPELPAGKGPFGLEAGISRDLIEQMAGQPLVLSDKVQSLYILAKPPKPNSAFENYAIVISPTVGLCQIRAIGKSMSSNSFGHQLRDEFTQMQTSLTSVYGRPEVLDFLMSGSIWKDPSDWMMALYKKERSLIAEWAGTSKEPLKNDVQNITMVARAENTGKGYVMLQYSFSNHDVCAAEQEERSAGSL